MAEQGWTWEWPTEPGLYLVYGGFKGERPTLLVCRCARSSNGPLAYVAGGIFLFKEEGWSGVFRPLEVPAEAVVLFNEGPPSCAEQGDNLREACEQLVLWSKRAPAVALVAYEAEISRITLTRMLEDKEVYMGAIFLPELAGEVISDVPPRHVIDKLIDLLGTRRQATSVFGFGSAFTQESRWRVISAQEEADAITHFNMRREQLISPDCFQVWWMPTTLADLLEHSAPDLMSCVRLKVRI
jgi:hypothetical protein